MNNDLSNYTYKQAIDELEKIVSEIETGELDLDELLKKVDFATTLILFCKEKLKNAEITLEDVMKKFDDSKE
ncbi:MAG: hypothetical protein OHK0036_19160 [Bacteroidia bacterium]